jgi:hypothetical protein
MFNLNDLENGMSAANLLPKYKDYLSALEAQKKKFEIWEIEAGLGPEPVRTIMTAGESEMWQLKCMSRHPFGSVIVKKLNAGIKVLSWLDDEGNEDDVYRLQWKRLSMDKKLETSKIDYRVGGTSFFEIGLDDDGDFLWNVKSPKKVTSFSSDLVNSDWADYAIEVFKNSGVEHFRYFDTQVILTFKAESGKTGWSLVDWEEHKIGRCPIVRVDNAMNSDGEVRGNLELMKPALDTSRQRTNALSQGAYWTGTRSFVIENMDLEETATDPDTLEEYNVAERVLESIRMTDAGVVLLPPGSTAGGGNPTLSQTEEGNLSQLVAAKIDSLRDLATLSGLPYSVFDPSAVSTTLEASVQAASGTNDAKDLDKDRIGAVLERCMEQLHWAKTGEWREFNILWAVNEQVSIASLSDTVSKLAASGIPLPWIVRNVLAGYRPNQIQDLLMRLEQQDELMTGMTKMMGGL